MDEKELAELLDRYQRDECTPEERLLLESLHLHTYKSKPVMPDLAAKKRVWHRLDHEFTSRSTNSIFTPWLIAAASIILVATVALLYLAEYKETPLHTLADIPSGGNKAVLRLADGQTINLDNRQQGLVVLEDRLVYTDSTLASDFYNIPSTDKQLFNEIVTPRGGTFQVVLTDGTKVWLNADSKLTFPQQFNSQNRLVMLTGEAYFEVSKSKKRPFVVKTAGQEITVLGTSFNVVAYDDEASEQTTLVEGKVVVTTPTQSNHLSPGEQAVVSASNVTIGKVDTTAFVAWKAGLIAFNEETLEQIMRNISRWYDVDVHFEGVDKTLRFGGEVSRYANVSEVLHRLELTGQVHFKLEERGIVVTR